MTALVVAVVAAVATNPSAAPPELAFTAAPSTEAPRPPRVAAPTTSTTATTLPPAPTTTEVAVLGAALEASAAPPPPPPPRRAPPPPPPPPPPAFTVSPGAEAEVLAYINARRAEHGLGAVSRSGCLDGIARSWSQGMASRQTLAHNPSAASQAGSCVAWRAAGENVGYASSAAQVNQLWWDSSPHRAAMLGTAYTQVGIGAVWDGSKMWITVDFVG